jgi:peptidoglycan LD-endopeptidase LytH
VRGRVINRDIKRTARTLGVGALCGFIIGAALVAVLITRYGPASRTATRASGSSAGGVSADGLASVDPPARERSSQPAPVGTIGVPAGVRSPVVASSPPRDLARRDLEIPVEGVKAEQLVRSFDQERSGARSHEAIDILAPRNTPVKAVENGRIVRLFESDAGGTTIYQFDPAEQYCYYYAHLERYAEGLSEGATVKKGQVIGYVGTSGNAPKNTPHLHFAILKLTPEKHWWEGTPIDPYDILR